MGVDMDQEALRELTQKKQVGDPSHPHPQHNPHPDVGSSSGGFRGGQAGSPPATGFVSCKKKNWSAYGGLGAVPPAGSRGRAPGQGVGGEAPL